MRLYKDDISRYKGEIMGTDFWETPEGIKQAWQEEVKKAYEKGFRDGLEKGFIDGRNAAIECIKTALKNWSKKRKL